MTWASDLITDLEEGNPLALQLGEMVSLAVRVDAELLRLARLTLCPQASAGDEADLWLSPLVESSANQGFVFHPEVARELRLRLADFPELLDEVWQQVMMPYRRNVPAKIRLEEELTWRLLRNPGDPELIKLQHEILRELAYSPNRTGVARWVIRAIPNLPASIAGFPQFQHLQVWSHLALGDVSILDMFPLSSLQHDDYQFLLSKLPRISLSVRFIEGALEFGNITHFKDGQEIALPETRPLWLAVKFFTQEKPQIFTLKKGESFLLPTDDYTVTITTIDGSEYELKCIRSERFVARNRVPRVQIEYDVELYGTLKKVQLPFVMGVLSDLSGQPAEPLADIADRKFLEIDVDNFNDRLRSMRPRVVFQIPDVITGEGNISVDITFTRMDDFSPAAVVANVETLKEMLDQKTRSDLATSFAQQLNLILHHPDFQRLEGAWRGLHYLVNNTETDEMLKIRVLNVTKSELFNKLKQFQGAAWDQSPLFVKIYEEEFGQLGGQPYGCFVGDYYFDHSSNDVLMLNEIAKICAAAHAPFLAGVAPTILDMESWVELANPRDLAKAFAAPGYAAWHSLRESDDSRYLGLTLPRMLSRFPYGANTNSVGAFPFEEDTSDSEKLTWMNAAYAMAVNINRAFKLYGWCAQIRGIESGGAVEGLPVYASPSDDGGVDIRCPTEISIGDRREAELARCGFMPLVHKKNTDFAAFLGAESLQKPAKYDDPDANANAALGARLPYLFAVCRFAHYLKCMVRDKFGAFKDCEDLRRWLNGWIINYVHAYPEMANQSEMRLRPLASAEVVVEEDREGLGYHSAKFYLLPIYQFEGLTVPLCLVSKLPSVKKAA